MNLIKTIILTCLVLFSSTVIAHTPLTASSPKNNDVLSASPESIALEFKADVRLMKFNLVSQEEKAVTLDFKPNRKPEKAFSIEVPELELGKYKASWMIMGEDGHKIKGEFAFTVDTLSSPTVAVKEQETAVLPKQTDEFPLVTVYKSESCGCCNAWIEHMQDNGFRVEAHNSNNLNQYKIKAKLGPALGSCHTAFVGDYAIEGHVPASDVKRLLAEKPDVSGLTAPGMPMQSPGMAPKGSKPANYDVISYKDGKVVEVFTKY